VLHVGLDKVEVSSDIHTCTQLARYQQEQIQRLDCPFSSRCELIRSSTAHYLATWWNAWHSLWLQSKSFMADHLATASVHFFQRHRHICTTYLMQPRCARHI